MSSSPAPSAENPPIRSRRRQGLRQDLLPLGLVLLAAVGALWPVCRAEFVQWDDQVILYNNASLTPPTWASVRLWWTRPHQRLYTPVAYTVWGLLARVSGLPLNPHVFHTANLFLHLLTTAVAYFLLKRLISLPWPAAAGAGLFALHPVQVESFAHASGIQGLLSGLFSLTTVLLYLRSVGEHRLSYQAARLVGDHAETPESPPSDRLRPGLYAAATVALLLAVLSKPAALVTPMLAALLHVLWLGGKPGEAARRLWPWLLISLVCGAVVRIIQVPPPHDVAIPFYYRPLIAGFSLSFYLYKLLVPDYLGLVYPWTTPPALTRGDLIYYTWLLPAALAAALWQAWKAKPSLRPLAVGALWFAVGLLPVLGFTRFDFQQFSTVAFRYLYLPMFGVALCAAWALALPWCRRWWRAVSVLCVLVLGALAVRSHLQTLVWHDTASLFRNAYRVNPGGGPPQERGE